ncbi:hemerythrin [Peptoclostridium litorale DSM 5388]|uniref:Hemerythrin-like metal-binding protein n=1 Tax=Peptoclostridium litorale DSM 5388 TaxID=1121324 RepID=A0A069RI66_PEPLI|nr:bacteriohemerythrin [Peptoclostridium litorale]KDR96724.1 hemerythrin-like metal-binding protein [Peptoclostridium litorale DSM 5388]SIN67405.1 hemerythrin [Peptoclostridium litorale DSM 5388]
MLKWNDKYSVGVESIDSQHKRLFEIGNELIAAMKSDKFDKYDDIMYILGELKDYTVYHFDFEESLLKSNGVEFTDSHAQQHTFFIDKLMETTTLDIDAQQGQVLNDIFEFLTDWIVNHIMNTDKTYQASLNSAGVH